MIWVAVAFFVGVVITGRPLDLLRDEKKPPLPPVRVEVDFPFYRADLPGFGDRSGRERYVENLASRFEGRLVDGGGWPADLRVTGTVDPCGGRGATCVQIKAQLQVRSEEELSVEAVRLALGVGRMTVRKIVNPVPKPCSGSDTENVRVVRGAVGVSGCYRTEQDEIRVLSDVTVDSSCAVPAAGDPVTPLFRLYGENAQWLEAWALRNAGAALVLIVDSTAVGIVKVDELVPNRVPRSLSGFAVPADIACGYSALFPAESSLLPDGFEVR